MTLRIFKYVWFFSLLATMAIFFYVYASLPLEVLMTEGTEPISVSREVLFYSLLGIIAVVNVLVFLVAKFFPDSQSDFKTWFYGFIVTLNLFIVTLVNFSGVYNSGEKFDYSKIGILIYGSIGLIVIWAISWPVYSLSRKILSKQQV